jgi:TolB protein
MRQRTASVTRRELVQSALGCMALPTGAASSQAAAETRAPVRIAIPDLTADAGDNAEETAREITALVIADLATIGGLLLLDRAAYRDTIVDVNVAPAFDAWRAIGADALLIGRTVHQADGRLRAETRLWDVASGYHLSGYQYHVNPERWRALAHAIAGTVCERLTGEMRDFR